MVKKTLSELIKTIREQEREISELQIKNENLHKDKISISSTLMKEREKNKSKNIEINTEDGEHFFRGEYGGVVVRGGYLDHPEPIEEFAKDMNESMKKTIPSEVVERVSKEISEKHEKEVSETKFNGAVKFKGNLFDENGREKIVEDGEWSIYFEDTSNPLKVLKALDILIGCIFSKINKENYVILIHTNVNVEVKKWKGFDIKYHENEEEYNILKITSKQNAKKEQ